MISPFSKFLTISLKFLTLIVSSALVVSGQYRFDNWTTDSGLPQNSVFEVMQTSDGYLWLATVDGLARFDGVRFQVFNRSNSPGIGNNRFISLFEDAHGDLWAGTEESGVTRLHAGRFESFDTVDGKPLGMISHITDDVMGNPILAGPGPDAIRFADGQFSVFDSAAPSTALGGWRRGRSIRLPCRNRLDDPKVARCYVNGGWSDFAIPVSAAAIEQLRVVQDADGNVWLISGTDANLFRIENDRPVPIDQKGLPGKPVRFVTGSGLFLISKDDRGALWLTDLRLMQSGMLLDAKAPEVDTLVNAAHVSYRDSEGNLWFGSVRAGLFRARKQVVTTLSKPEGLIQSTVYPIYQTRDGEIWVGTLEGLFNLHDGIFKPVGEARSWVHAIGEDADGHLLFSVWEKLHIRTENGVEQFSSAEFPNVGPINAIHVDGGRTLWVGGYEGLVRYADGISTKFTTADGLAGNDVKVIIGSKSGGLWIGTYGGLSKFENGKLTSWTATDGLPSRTIRSLYEDTEGALWIGTYDSGIARFKDGKFTLYNSRIGLYNDGAFQILEDDKRQFWISSNRGIYRVSKDELNEFADGKRSNVSSIAYGKSDGMLNAECNGGRSPAGFKMRDGKLWFPTQDGVSIIDPGTVASNSQPPPVVIESIKIDNKDAGLGIADLGFIDDQPENSDPSSKIQLDPSQQSFEIQYTALSFINPENMRFNYRLEGLEQDWVDAGTRRTAYYSHVDPGEYTFRVVAANADGVWNTAGKSLKIVVLPPFYRTTWFLGITIFVFGVSVFVLYRRRVSKLENANRLQEEFSRRLINANESERRRVAAELHDSIGQSLALIKNRAVLSAESVLDETVRQQLEFITAQTTQTIGEVREISYALRPYLLDDLGLTKAIRSLINKVVDTSKLEIQSELDNVDDVFDPEAEMSIYRIIQESLGNVMKHAEAKNVQVFLKTSDRNLTILVSDDGKGFDPIQNKIVDAGKGGFGLLGIGERVKMLGGTEEVESHPGEGTTILIKIPIRNNE